MKINNVKLYNQSFPEEKVKDLYNGQNITEGLVGHWPLNEGQSCTAYDNSENSNNGTLNPNCPDNSPEWIIGN